MEKIVFVLLVVASAMQAVQAMPGGTVIASEGIEPFGLVTIGDHQYYISDSSRLIWPEASAACAGIGMKMLSLETAEKNELIKSYFRANGMGLTAYWTGGRKEGGRSWEWSGLGVPITYSDWADSQPDDVGDAYVQLNAVYGWFDMPASLKIHYVCE